jgi:hypothetical protein
MQPSFHPTARGTARGAVAGILALAAAAALTLGATGAFASSAKPGNYLGQFKYHGTLITSEVLSFKVSGNTVKKARITPFLPSKCGAGGKPPTMKSKNGKIKNGKFTAVAEEVFQGKVTGKSKIEGKFTSPKKVKGTIKSTFPKLPQCTATYTFTAKPATGG